MKPPAARARARTTPSATVKFDTAGALLAEAAAVYAEYKSGRLGDDKARIAGYLLQVSGALWRTCELERRMAEIEKTLARLEKDRRV